MDYMLSVSNDRDPADLRAEVFFIKTKLFCISFHRWNHIKIYGKKITFPGFYYESNENYRQLKLFGKRIHGKYKTA